MRRPLCLLLFVIFSTSSLMTPIFLCQHHKESEVSCTSTMTKTKSHQHISKGKDDAKTHHEDHSCEKCHTCHLSLHLADKKSTPYFLPLDLSYPLGHPLYISHVQTGYPNPLYRPPISA